MVDRVGAPWRLQENLFPAFSGCSRCLHPSAGAAPLVSDTDPATSLLPCDAIVPPGHPGSHPPLKTLGRIRKVRCAL